MKIKTSLMALGACALLATANTSMAQDDDYMLRMNIIDVKIGHMTKFREGMAAYNACYSENDGDGSWTVWNNVVGGGDYYYMVGRMDAYAEMDEMDEATRACWSVIEEQVAPHVIDVRTRIAKRLGAWSGENQNTDVVELHHFRVAENRDFRQAVSAITTILKEADYEYMGVWYQYMHNSSNEPDYFVVDAYENFAAMDEDRPGAYRAVREAVGEERADELWEAFGDSLTDDWEYRNEVLSRINSLTMSQDD
jgi:hypothetical protein